jgi:sugar/nucleoside kinase (ribokinase family)
MTAARPVQRADATGAGAVADVLLEGTVYLDIVFTGLAGPPAPGREVRSSGFGWSPGGVANLAVALRRLGLGVRLSATFSTDRPGQDLWQALVDEGIGLEDSARVDDWPTPITVCMAYAGDRSMVTYERGRPVPGIDVTAGPLPRAAVAYLGHDAPDWPARATAAGILVVADVGWDETGRWDPADLDGLDHCAAFLPNAAEAMAYTRTETPEAAARALAGRVPLVVVKCASQGSIAMRAGDAELIHEPPIEVDAIDPTGAGDVFDAAVVFGLLTGWSVPEMLRFGNLCAGLSVRHHGGSLSAPDWGEIDAWLGDHPERSADFAFVRVNRGG